MVNLGRRELNSNEKCNKINKPAKKLSIKHNINQEVILVVMLMSNIVKIFLDGIIKTTSFAWLRKPSIKQIGN